MVLQRREGFDKLIEFTRTHQICRGLTGRTLNVEKVMNAASWSKVRPDGNTELAPVVVMVSQGAHIFDAASRLCSLPDRDR